MKHVALKGEPAKLIGTCAQCGRCCTGMARGRPTVCAALERSGELGQPQATRCRAYAQRRHFMPIVMLYQDDGQPANVSRCMADGTPEETSAIVRKGIGRGCSLFPVFT